MYTGKYPRKSSFLVKGPVNINILQLKIQDRGFDRFKSSTWKLVYPYFFLVSSDCFHHCKGIGWILKVNETD